jgi:hypothetical protein
MSNPPLDRVTKIHLLTVRATGVELINAWGAHKATDFNNIFDFIFTFYDNFDYSDVASSIFFYSQFSLLCFAWTSDSNKSTLPIFDFSLKFDLLSAQR